MIIELEHNCAWGWSGQYLASDGETPIDCTGGTLAAEIRPEPGGVLLGSFDLEWLDAENGWISQRIEAAAVNAIPDGRYQSDLIFTDSNGIPTKLRRDSVIKRGTITEPTP